MEFEQTINTVVGCVMASYLGNDEKRVVIDSLRRIEAILNELHNNGGITEEKAIITNAHLSYITANKSMNFDCPKCNHNQIVKTWNYTHNYCPRCGVKIIWDLNE